MKVLSIKEPYATLIKEGIKKIETRSFKTNYRGRILIHASKSKDKFKSINDSVRNLSKDLEMNYGKIICEVNLVDCVYMDEEYIEKIKKDNLEYSLGLYEIGRYAWILSDLKVLDDFIEAKGRLNLWEYPL